MAAGVQFVGDCGSRIARIAGGYRVKSARLARFPGADTCMPSRIHTVCGRAYNVCSRAYIGKERQANTGPGACTREHTRAPHSHGAVRRRKCPSGHAKARHARARSLLRTV